MSRWLNRFQPHGILLLRLVLGVALLKYGWPKVFGPAFHIAHPFVATKHALNEETHFVASLGLPYWLGYVSAFTELVGGILLILGLFTRFIAFLVTINMLVAITMVTMRHGYSASEYPIALAAIAILLVLTGAGKAALDQKIGIS
jgi:putative oxidoreductase